ncbi:hypothetical protein MKleb_5893 (plasmid) [Klebsiella sp. PL-2018]|nr:hypothetical protein MKleb_5819 [Klebsiella sp. PL-2018]QXD01394.1 hypothetical protein MKleb_5893 [Klebsiella sp. PL-2018]
MPVQLSDCGLRIGGQLKIPVVGRNRFQTVIEEAFGQALTEVFSRTARTFSASINLL